MGRVEDFKRRAIYKSLNIIVIILIITVFLISIVTITREKKMTEKALSHRSFQSAMILNQK